MSVAARTLLVTGGSGRLAREVIALLLRRGTDRVVAATRTPDRIGDLRALGVEVRPLDFDDDESAIARALEGADRMLLVSTHAVGRRAVQQGKAVRAAERAGVGHLLYTSATSPAPTAASAIVSDHFWTEHAILRSSLSWTILRNNMYAEHVLLFLPGAVASGELRTSLGGGARAYVTRSDCAAAAAAALAGDGTDCRIHDIGGPDALTTDDVLEIVRDLTGREIRHVPVSDQEALRAFVDAGLPPGFPESALGFDVWARAGHHAIVTSAVHELTGRAPTSLRSYLDRHREALLAGRGTVEL